MTVQEEGFNYNIKMLLEFLCTCYNDSISLQSFIKAIVVVCRYTFLEKKQLEKWLCVMTLFIPICSYNYNWILFYFFQLISFLSPIVPDQAALFRATDVQKHALTLSWSPPVEANGVLTGCVLQYQLSMAILMHSFRISSNFVPSKSRHQETLL